MELKITVVQPPYFAGEYPDAVIADFLMERLDEVDKGSLILLPEYSNAGGISDPEAIIAALPRAKKMLSVAADVARLKAAYVAINVLEKRDGKIKNSTYLFDKQGNVAFIYDKQHLPPAEVKLGIEAGNGSGKCSCVCDIDGIRFAFLTCYDAYFNEQIEFIAKHRPDIILVPGYQRGERVDIIRAQAKLTAFRCNAFLVRSSFSMNSDEKGGCTMIVASDGQILEDMGKNIGSISATVDPHHKHMRSAGFGGDLVRNDDFIAEGLCPEAFQD